MISSVNMLVLTITQVVLDLLENGNCEIAGALLAGAATLLLGVFLGAVAIGFAASASTGILGIFFLVAINYLATQLQNLLVMLVEDVCQLASLLIRLTRGLAIVDVKLVSTEARI